MPQGFDVDEPDITDSDLPEQNSLPMTEGTFARANSQAVGDENVDRHGDEQHRHVGDRECEESHRTSR